MGHFSKQNGCLSQKYEIKYEQFSLQQTETPKKYFKPISKVYRSKA